MTLNRKQVHVVLKCQERPVRHVFPSRGAGCRGVGVGVWEQGCGAGVWVQGCRCRGLGSGCRGLGAGVWVQESGGRGLCAGVWGQGSRGRGTEGRGRRLGVEV